MNRTRRTLISNGSYEEYTWDYRNRLTAVTFKNSSHVVQKTVAYEYDAFNRLIRRTYDADGPGGGAAADQFFAFDEGINPLLEFDANTAADVSHRYLWGPQVDQLFADEQVTTTGSAGNALWALSDNLGTIRDIADLSGSTTSITNHRRFAAYGNIVSESNAAVDMLFAFTGKLYDEVTGLQNNLNRWYDAKLGQWMSEDPIGFEAGDANVRRYVGNDVALETDSRGLAFDIPRLDDTGKIHTPKDFDWKVHPNWKKPDLQKLLEDLDTSIRNREWDNDPKNPRFRPELEAGHKKRINREKEYRGKVEKRIDDLPDPPKGVPVLPVVPIQSPNPGWWRWPKQIYVPSFPLFLMPIIEPQYRIPGNPNSGMIA